MVARDGVLGNLYEVLEAPIFVFTACLENFEMFYPSHIVLSQIGRGLSGEDSDVDVDVVDSGVAKKGREWPDGYDPSMDLSQEEAWKVWADNGGSMVPRW